MGNNSTFSECEFHDHFIVSYIFFVAGLVILLENVIGILVIWLSPALHTTTNIFVCSMALTDVSVGVSFCFANLLIILSDFSLVPLTIAADGLSSHILVFSMSAISSAHMAVIAAERYMYILHPFFYRRHMTPKCIVIILTSFWILSVACVWIVCHVYYQTKDVTFCNRLRNDVGAYVGSTIYTTSAIVSCVLYSRITKTASSRVKRCTSFAVYSNSNQHIDIKYRYCIALKNSNTSLKGNMKSIKFFILVFGFFILLTFPALTIAIVDKIFNTEVPHSVFRVSIALVVFSSGVNFVVLAMLNSAFQQAIKTKLCCLCNKSCSWKEQ